MKNIFQITFILVAILFFNGACKNETKSKESTVNDSEPTEMECVIQNFSVAHLPYHSDSVKYSKVFPFKDSVFITQAIDKRKLMAVEDSALKHIQWDGADVGFPKHLCYAGRLIFKNEKFYLLEFTEELVPGRKTLICTFTHEGAFINGIVSSYGDGNKYGFIERKSEISENLVLTVRQKGGWHEDPPHYYNFKAVYELLDNGEFKKMDTKLLTEL